MVAAIVENPWAGQGFVEDLGPGIDANASDLGALWRRWYCRLWAPPREAYGKAGIVGLDGEVEHGSALIHTLKFGDHFRKAANATTLLPAVEKRGPAGIVFDIPLKHITDSTIRSHHQTIEVRISDAPHPDELIIALLRRRRVGRSSGSPRCPPSSSDHGSRPRVVLLHGVGLDRTMWQPIIELLDRAFEVTAPDLLGHGANKPAPDGVTLADLAADLADTIDPQSHLVGFSLGAMVAQHLSVHRPELVATLTSVSSVCRRNDSERAAVLARLDAATEDFTGSVRASLKRWYAGTPTDPALVAATEATLLANDVPSYLNCYRVFATADAQIGTELGDISAPALAVTGELDPGSTPEMTFRLADALPDCRAVVVPEARHMLPVQQPEVLADLLATFIGERAHV